MFRLLFVFTRLRTFPQRLRKLYSIFRTTSFSVYAKLEGLRSYIADYVDLDSYFPASHPTTTIYRNRTIRPHINMLLLSRFLVAQSCVKYYRALLYVSLVIERVSRFIKVPYLKRVKKLNRLFRKRNHFLHRYFSRDVYGLDTFSTNLELIHRNRLLDKGFTLPAYSHYETSRGRRNYIREVSRFFRKFP